MCTINKSDYKLFFLSILGKSTFSHRPFAWFCELGKVNAFLYLVVLPVYFSRSTDLCNHITGYLVDASLFLTRPGSFTRAENVYDSITTLFPHLLRNLV